MIFNSTASIDTAPLTGLAWNCHFGRLPVTVSPRLACLVSLLCFSLATLCSDFITSLVFSLTSYFAQRRLCPRHSGCCWLMMLLTVEKFCSEEVICCSFEMMTVLMAKWQNAAIALKISNVCTHDNLQRNYHRRGQRTCAVAWKYVVSFSEITLICTKATGGVMQPLR